MAKIVCFIGVQGSGKDYRCKKLIKQGLKQINFADALRDITWDALGWQPGIDADYERFKDLNIELKTNYNRVINSLTGRQFLQNLGTEAIRSRFPDFWVDLWRQKVLKVFPDNNICCSDLRFINELQTAYGFNKSIFIFCNYKTIRYKADDLHESERLAQRILSDRFKDGDRLPIKYIESILRGD